MVDKGAIMGTVSNEGVVIPARDDLPTFWITQAGLLEPRSFQAIARTGLSAIMGDLRPGYNPNQVDLLADGPDGYPDLNPDIVAAAAPGNYGFLTGKAVLLLAIGAMRFTARSQVDKGLLLARSCQLSGLPIPVANRRGCRDVMELADDPQTVSMEWLTNCGRLDLQVAVNTPAGMHSAESVSLAGRKDGLGTVTVKFLHGTVDEGLINQQPTDPQRVAQFGRGLIVAARPY